MFMCYSVVQLENSCKRNAPGSRISSGIEMYLDKGNSRDPLHLIYLGILFRISVTALNISFALEKIFDLSCHVILNQVSLFGLLNHRKGLLKIT